VVVQGETKAYLDGAVQVIPEFLATDKENLFSFAEYLAACCEDEGEENPP
jgi:hypothetical protein